MVSAFAPPTNERFRNMKLGRRFGAVAAGAVAVAGMVAGVGVASAAPNPLPTPTRTQPALVAPVLPTPTATLQARVLPGQQARVLPGQARFPGQPWLRGPQVLTRWLPQVDAGDTERVAVRLRGLDRRVCNVKVFVQDSRRVDVSYPYGRRYASLSHGSTLTLGEQDRAVFYVEADEARRDYNERLRGTVAYDGCGWNARTQYKQFNLVLPVAS